MAQTASTGKGPSGENNVNTLEGRNGPTTGAESPQPPPPRAWGRRAPADGGDGGPPPSPPPTSAPAPDLGSVVIRWGTSTSSLGGALLPIQASRAGAPVWDVCYPDQGGEAFVAASHDFARRLGWTVERAEQELAPLFNAARQRLAAARSRAEGETPPGFLEGIVTSAAFQTAEYQRDWLVRGLLVRNQPVIVGGPTKSLKTSLALDLALSLASGKPFLGFSRFAVPRRARTLVLSGESGEATLQEMARRICRSKFLRLETCDVRWGFRLPQLSSDEDLRALEAYLQGEAIGVVIIDPLYLCLLGGGGGLSTANLFEVGPRLLAVTRACLDGGATPILVHHTRKQGRQQDRNRGAPLDLNDLSHSGFAEFARQRVLLNPREPYEHDSGLHKLWLQVGGSAGQGGLWAVDVREGRLDDQFAGRCWEVTVRSTAEAQAAKGAETRERDLREAREAVVALL